MTGKRYRCASCGGTFIAEWTDQEAQAEHAKNFPEVGPTAELAEICDDCYQRFMRWLEEHPEEREPHGW